MENRIGQKLYQGKPSRQARLDAWLAERGVKKIEIARELGISSGMMSHIVMGRKAPPALIQRMIDLGIPADLLPSPGGNDKNVDSRVEKSA